ncbi:hypothetical protein ACO9S2_10500 [Nitrospira sp. NS4]|uniref:hypothetical protein n=1 Tax=Nitrospira sp. NS4 TaxID=3414498 RepID=UPI003C308AEB
MMVESLTRRVLAALRVVDGVTGQPILSPLSVSGAGTLWVRNRRGLYVLTGMTGLEAHQDGLMGPPATPAVGSMSVVVDVRDMGSTYLSRRQTIRLPRDPDPVHAGESGSVFRPIESRLYLSPSAPTSSAWAVIRVTVVREGTEQGLGGTLIRVLRASDGEVLARGISDGRGEALVAVPGIPVMTWEDAPGPVMGTEVDVQVEVVCDPGGGEAPDPDQLEANRATLPNRQTAMKLTSGRTVVRKLTVAIP